MNKHPLKPMELFEGTEESKQNPFLTSEIFTDLIKGIAMLPKVILLASSGPSEALNSILSVVITFLNNVPDKLWAMLMEASKETPDCEASKALQLLDGLRSFKGKKQMIPCITNITNNKDQPIPVWNAPVPKQPC